MDKNNKNRSVSYLNILSITVTFFVLLFILWLRNGLIDMISIYDSLKLFSLVIVVFILPDYISVNYLTGDKWFKTSEFVTFLLLFFLGFSGIFLDSYRNWVGYIIVPIGAYILIWELINFFRIKKNMLFLAGLGFFVLVYIMFYIRGYQSPLFPERIILGIAHIDTLFHSSISNMINTFGWSSTGLDGVPYYNYHWASHALLGGMANWTGMSIISFNNIGYPVIFIPLFFKSFFSFLNKIYRYKKENTYDILFTIAFFTVAYTSFTFFENAKPLGGASFNMSMIFTFLYASVLMSFSTDQIRKNYFFYYSIVFVLLISFIKISTGLVMMSGLVYLFLRYNRRVEDYIKIIISLILISILIYLFVYPIARTINETTIFVRIYCLWADSQGFITYLFGLFFAIVFILKRETLESFSDFKALFHSKKYIDLELLIVLTLAGFAGGIMVTANKSDVANFSFPQMFITIPYLVYLLDLDFKKYKASDKIKKLFLYTIIALSLISRPDLFKIKGGILELMKIKNEISSLSSKQKIFKNFISELFILEKEQNKKSKCVFLPKTETWYYNSQSFKHLGAPFVVPAIAGVALINGVPDEIINSDYNYYSYYYYKKGNSKTTNDLDGIKQKAVKNKFKEIYLFKYVDGRLQKKKINLE